MIFQGEQRMRTEVYVSQAVSLSSWPVPEGLHPMERALAGATLEELHPMGRTHIGDARERLFLVRGPPWWSN